MSELKTLPDPSHHDTHLFWCIRSELMFSQWVMTETWPWSVPPSFWILSDILAHDRNCSWYKLDLFRKSFYLLPAMCYTNKSYCSSTTAHSGTWERQSWDRGRPQCWQRVKRERDNPVRKRMNGSGVNVVCDADCESTENRYCVFIWIYCIQSTSDHPKHNCRRVCVKFHTVR